MNREAHLQAAGELVHAWAKTTAAPEPNRLDVTVEPVDLVAAVSALHQAGWGYLAAITGLDLGVDAGLFEVLYHFCSGPEILTLRVPVSRRDPWVPSLYDVIPSVSFYERELIEMFGITVMNTPNTDRLFLPDDWPRGTYPLRKDYKPRSSAV